MISGELPPLAVVTAPAGAGKTHAVRAALADTSTLWVTMREHQHAVDLAGHLVRRLRTRHAGVPADLSAAVGPSAGPASDADPLGRAEQLGGLIASALETSTRSRPLTLVLDEVERLDGHPGPKRLIEGIVRRAPHGLRTVVITRTDPGFAVQRSVADGTARQLDYHDLAPTSAELRGLVAEQLEIGDDRPIDGGRIIDAVVAASRGVAGTAILLTALASRMIAAGRVLTLHELLDDLRVRADVDDRAAVALIDELDAVERVLLDELAIVGVGSVIEAQRLAESVTVLDRLRRQRLIETLPDDEESLRCARALTDVVGRDARRLAAHAPAIVRAALERGHPRVAIDAAMHGDDDLVAATLDDVGASAIADGDGQLVLAAIDQLAPATRTTYEGLAGRANQALGNWWAALQRFERAVEHGVVDAADAWRHGLILYLQGDVRGALAVYRRVLDTPDDVSADAESDPADRAMLAGYAGAASWLAGDVDDARRLAAEALTSGVRVNSDAALAVAHTVAALVAASDGDRLTNDWHYVRALQHAERAGDTLQIARIRSNQGSKLLEEGEFRAALDELDAAVRSADLGGYGAVLAIALTNRGEALTKLGRLDEARTDLTAAVDLLHRQGSRIVAYPLAELARLFVARGDVEQARAAGEEAVRLADESGDRQLSVTAHLHLARALADHDPEAADRHGATAAERADTALDVAEVRAVLARFAASAGDAENARQLAQRAAEAARARRDRFGLALALDVLGEVETSAAARRTRLDESRKLFDDIGSELEAARVELTILGDDRSAEADARVGAIARLAARAGARPLAAAAHAELERRRNHAPAPVEVVLLGGFAVRVDGRPVPANAWQSRKARTLFKMLAARRRPLTRDAAIEALWPDDEPGKATNKLSVALATIRGVLDPEHEHPADRYLHSDGQSIALDEETVSVDVERFLGAGQAALRRHREGATAVATSMLADAEARYTGDALEDDPYEAWFGPIREQARSCYLGVARALVERRIEEADGDDAMRLLLRILECEPYDEHAHVTLVDQLTTAGRHGDARRAYQRYSERMRELDLEPRAFATP